MAYTTIDKPNQYFNTVLYTGDGNNSRTVTGTGFQPDWVWVKVRDTGYAHKIFDSVRGAGKRLMSQSTNAEATVTDELTSFDSDGFTTNNNAGMNENTRPYVAWNWLADNTSGSSNTDGSITSSVSANTTSGFSIVSYTGNGTAGATVGHSLGSTPQVVLIKNRDQADNWAFTGEIGSLSYGTNYLRLNGTNALITSSNQVTSASSSTFTLGTGVAVNTNTEDYIAYCFAEKKGYSKAFSYTGNGSTDGTFTYLGFKPAWVFLVSTGSNGYQRFIFDNKRDTYNLVQNPLAAQDSAAEPVSASGYRELDFLSNGIKIRASLDQINFSGQQYIGFAIAENPFTTSTGIPTTAR